MNNDTSVFHATDFASTPWRWILFVIQSLSQKQLQNRKPPFIACITDKMILFFCAKYNGYSYSFFRPVPLAFHLPQNVLAMIWCCDRVTRIIPILECHVLVDAVYICSCTFHVNHRYRPFGEYNFSLDDSHDIVLRGRCLVNSIPVHPSMGKDRERFGQRDKFAFQMVMSNHENRLVLK